MQNYYVGANDEHGQNPPTAGKRTPILPYLNRPFYENEFNRPAKNAFVAACLRCGLDVFDVKPEVADLSISKRVARINKQNLTLLVTFGYNAFGSGNTFNSVKGCSTFYSQQNRFPTRSLTLAEEIFAQLADVIGQMRSVTNLVDVGVLSSVNCVSALVEPGYMTNLQEAKQMLDPDFQTAVAEGCARGVCNFLGAYYVPRELGNFPLLKTGSRGNFVEELQFLLTTQGFGIAVDGSFGSGTTQAVKNFQAKNGLTADGVVGPNTWRTLLVLPPKPTLRMGSKGTYVEYLQNKLTSKLYPLGKADGIFGNGTKNAVTEFQKENGLSPDGIVGPLTWQTLETSTGRT